MIFYHYEPTELLGEDQKLAAIEAELQTLRALGRHPNLAGVSGHMTNHAK